MGSTLAFSMAMSPSKWRSGPWKHTAVALGAVWGTGRLSNDQGDLVLGVRRAGLGMVRPGPGPPECSADGMQAPVYRSGQSMTFGQAAVGSQLLSGIPAPSSPDAPPRPATSLPAAPGAAAPSLQTPHSALPRTTHCQGPLLPAALGADCLVAQIGTPKSQHPKPSPKSSASWEGS